MLVGDSPLLSLSSACKLSLLPSNLIATVLTIYSFQNRNMESQSICVVARHRCMVSWRRPEYIQYDLYSPATRFMISFSVSHLQGLTTVRSILGSV
jgi:hypothetical protein